MINNGNNRNNTPVSDSSENSEHRFAEDVSNFDDVRFFERRDGQQIYFSDLNDVRNTQNDIVNNLTRRILDLGERRGRENNFYDEDDDVRFFEHRDGQQTYFSDLNDVRNTQNDIVNNLRRILGLEERRGRENNFYDEDRVPNAIDARDARALTVLLRGIPENSIILNNLGRPRHLDSTAGNFQQRERRSNIHREVKNNGIDIR